jgi:glucosyl-dolichyl phosphate glucuronosyltransferase
MRVSIVLPTYNNAKMLGSTLAAFECVDFPEGSELIVVDNNSTDTTAVTVRSFSGRLPLRYAFEANRGVSSAKNRGICMSKGELLIFTDDDVRPVANWIFTFVSAFCHNPSGYFWGGPIESEFQGALPDERLLKFAPFSVKGLSFGTKERLLGDNEWFAGANWACPADALSQVGLFDETVGPYPGARVSLNGEETDLQMRLKIGGCSALYLPEASLRHVVPARKTTLKHIAARAEANGRFERRNSPFEKGTGTFCGVPLWRYRRCAERWAKAWTKRISGRDWYPDYISYRFDKGFLLGQHANTRDPLNDRSDGA